MKNKEKKELIFGMNEDLKPEDVPEPFREMVRSKLEAAKAGKESSDSSKIAIHKDLQFNLESGSGLGMILKLLINASQPPKPRAPAPPLQEEGAAASEERQETQREQPNPGAIRPSSTGWLVWVIAVILAVTYFLSSRALIK